MSLLNLFQRFVDEESVRSKMQLGGALSAILDYCEYSIRSDFNTKEKIQYRSKNRKNQLSKEFPLAFTTLSKEEKIEYYCMVVGFLLDFTQGRTDPPKSSYSGMLNTIGYSRSFNIKRWKQKKLRLDLDKHFIFAEREQKIKSYDLRNYILRRSKNKEYYSFVLEAINNVPPEKSMTVHMGFIEEGRLNEWIKAIKFSVDFRQWEFYLQLFRAAGFQKSTSARLYSTDDFLLGKGNDEIGKNNRKNTMDPKVELEDEDPLSVSMIVTSKNREFQNGDRSGMNLVKEEVRKTDPALLRGDRREEERRGREDERRGREEQRKVEERQRAEERSVSDSENKLQKAKLQQEIRGYEARKQMGKTLVDELMQGDVFEQPDVFEDKIEQEKQESKQIKRHLDLFHKLYPDYELDELQMYANFQLLHEADNLKIYQHGILERRLKLVMTFDRNRCNRQQLLSAISKPETSHTYNDNIESVQLKTYIPSENSALMYQVNKPYNRLYRARDFVFIRHVFNNGNNLYMIDKSVENTNYPPFMTIVRGSLCVVYGIFERSEKIEVIADFQVQSEGLLNPVQEVNLTLKYLKGFAKLLEAQLPYQSYKFFQMDWDISKNEANKIENEIRSRRKTINLMDKKYQMQHKIEENQKKEEKEIENRNFSKKQPRNQKTEIVTLEESSTPIKPITSESPVHRTKIQETSSQKSSEIKLSPIHKETSLSPQHRKADSPSMKKVEVRRFDQKSMEEVGEITGQDSKKAIFYQNVVRQVDKEGMVIISKSFQNTRYLLQPLPQSEVRLMEPYNGHPIWRGQWLHDDKEGGIIFIHKKKIEDQKGVLKFILSKIAKNLLTGQSITTISLPVDIFGPESNLQRFLFSMAYAPLLFEKLQKENMLSRLVRATIFGVSNSLLYLSMEKPFNPILGQTFQCWINGCPAYAEQISHHPPVGAVIFKGRGFDITAQLQSKVSLGVNSGTGTNEGICRVKFTDGLEICFITPGGEVSGLTAGDRKFNIVGKSHYWITDTNIMLQIVFDPFKKGFFSVGKQEKPSDYFEGTIWQVKPEFMNKFLGGKREQPKEKDRVKDYGKINGIWNKYICYNGVEIWNFDKQFPVVLQYEANPLPSDANWREDIQYRRRNEVTRAQIEKERLEVVQRKDRKFREKYHKKK